MPAILSPQPLSARGPRIRSVSNFPVYEPSFPIPMTHGRVSISQPRLMSPIQLSPSAIRPPSVIPKSIPKPPIKRRGKPTSRPPRRRRPFSCVECPVDPPTHAFDHLPWISALETAPDHYNPGDIADLSQFDNSCFTSSLPPAGPGPIRRRKTSLRANPLSPAQLPLTNSFPGDSAWAAGSALPFCDTPNQFNALSPPTTPNPTFNASRVLFHNLMPVSCDPHNDGLNDLKFTSLHH